MSAKFNYTIFSLGETALEIRFENRIDTVIHQEVMALYRSFISSPLIALADLIPAYCTLTLVFDRSKLLPSGVSAILPLLRQRIDALEIEQTTASSLIEIPVCYEGSYALDLKEVSRQCGLSVQEVITLHTQTEYTVFMLGFLPGFPYMGVLPGPLQLPRKQEPNFVKGGTIAIAGSQTGIYPQTSPGGWWQIGQTPLPLFDAGMQKPCLLEAGDRVRFYPIDEQEFLDIKKFVASTDIMNIRKKRGRL